MTNHLLKEGPRSKEIGFRNKFEIVGHREYDYSDDYNCDWEEEEEEEEERERPERVDAEEARCENAGIVKKGRRIHDASASVFRTNPDASGRIRTHPRHYARK